MTPGARTPRLRRGEAISATVQRELSRRAPGVLITAATTVDARHRINGGAGGGDIATVVAAGEDRRLITLRPRAPATTGKTTSSRSPARTSSSCRAVRATSRTPAHGGRGSGSRA